MGDFVRANIMGHPVHLNEGSLTYGVFCQSLKVSEGIAACYCRQDGHMTSSCADGKKVCTSNGSARSSQIVWRENVRHHHSPILHYVAAAC